MTTGPEVLPYEAVGPYSNHAAASNPWAFTAASNGAALAQGVYEGTVRTEGAQMGALEATHDGPFVKLPVRPWPTSSRR